MTFWHAVWSQAFLVGVAGNLVASAVWATPTFWQLHRKLDRRHADLLHQVHLARHYNDKDPYTIKGLDERGG